VVFPQFLLVTSRDDPATSSLIGQLASRAHATARLPFASACLCQDLFVRAFGPPPPSARNFEREDGTGGTAIAPIATSGPACTPAQLEALGAAFADAVGGGVSGGAVAEYLLRHRPLGPSAVAIRAARDFAAHRK